MDESGRKWVCPVPYLSVFIGYDGLYYLCCSDWKKEAPMASVFEASILATAVELARGGVDEFHGFELAKRLRDDEGRRNLTAHGTLYKALTRMEKAGLLTSVWEDPDFQPAQPAFYYARVLEVPSCRWTARACQSQGVDCAAAGTLTAAQRPCCDGAISNLVQERAWTSPIWYSPPAE